MKPWKAQKFFGDVVYDLRSRGLLPVVILLVVAMIAVPVLIARGGSSSSSGTLQPASVTAHTAPEAERAVVSYAPAGLRNYKSRLDDLSPKNPFRQPPSAAPSAAAASQLTSTAPGTGAAPVSTAPLSGGAGSTGGGGTGGGSSTGTSRTSHHLYLFHSVADLSFGDASQPLVRHAKIKTYAMLPNDTAPVLVYLGSTLDEKHALFSVSKYTDQLSGDGSCAPGPGDCALLSLGPGQTEEMVYAGDGKTYRLKINKINRVIIKNPSGN
jgi:hypothetical protein